MKKHHKALTALGIGIIAYLLMENPKEANIIIKVLTKDAEN